MKYFFYIQVIIACVHCCEEYLLTDMSRNKLVHIGLDFSTCKEYEIKLEALKFFIAGVINDNITIYWITHEPFVQFTSFDDSANFQPAKKIDVKRDKISTFEISPNFSKLFIATDDGIYGYDIESDLLSDVLKNQLFISGLTVLDEKKIFYSECNNKKGSFKTYDIEKRSEIDEVATEFCPKGVGYDQENDILFTYFDNGIYEKNVKEKSLILRYINPNVIICSMAVGVKHLFFVAYDEGKKLNDIYKMPIVPRPIATTLTIDYTSLPHVSVNEDKVIVLDVGGDQIIRLNRFNEIEKKWNVEIKNKNVISLKSSSTKLFWINRENEGVVITVDLTVNQLQTTELKFENLNGQHLIDIEVDTTNGNIAYLATSHKIYEGTINDLKTKEIADSDRGVKSMRLRPEEKILYMSECQDDKGYITKLDYNNVNLEQNSKQIDVCLQKFDLDEEKNIYGATSNMIYFIDKDLSNNIVKVCNAKDVTSLAIHKTHIYFISSEYKTNDKRLFRIKKEPATKSEDILTFQTEPAALTFIKKIPNIDEMKRKLLKSSSSPLMAKISSVLFIIILMRLVSRSSPINSN